MAWNSTLARIAGSHLLPTPNFISLCLETREWVGWGFQPLLWWLRNTGVNMMLNTSIVAYIRFPFRNDILKFPQQLGEFNPLRFRPIILCTIKCRWGCTIKCRWGSFSMLITTISRQFCFRITSYIFETLQRTVLWALVYLETLLRHLQVFWSRPGQQEASLALYRQM